MDILSNGFKIRSTSSGGTTALNTGGKHTSIWHLPKCLLNMLMQDRSK